MCQEEWGFLEVGLPERVDLGKGRVCLGDQGKEKRHRLTIK